jgi:hypothetical protein
VGPGAKLGDDGQGAAAVLRELEAARPVRQRGDGPFIGAARLLSVEGTEYAGRGTARRKGTPRGTGGPTGSSPGRSGTACGKARGARGELQGV